MTGGLFGPLGSLQALTEEEVEALANENQRRTLDGLSRRLGIRGFVDQAPVPFNSPALSTPFGAVPTVQALDPSRGAHVFQEPRSNSKDPTKEPGVGTRNTHQASYNTDAHRAGLDAALEAMARGASATQAAQAAEDAARAAALDAGLSSNEAGRIAQNAATQTLGYAFEHQEVAPLTAEAAARMGRGLDRSRPGNSTVLDAATRAGLVNPATGLAYSAAEIDANRGREGFDILDANLHPAAVNTSIDGINSAPLPGYDNYENDLTAANTIAGQSYTSETPQSSDVIGQGYGGANQSSTAVPDPVMAAELGGGFSNIEDDLTAANTIAGQGYDDYEGDLSAAHAVAQALAEQNAIDQMMADYEPSVPAPEADRTGSFAAGPNAAGGFAAAGPAAALAAAQAMAGNSQNAREATGQQSQPAGATSQAYGFGSGMNLGSLDNAGMPDFAPSNVGGFAVAPQGFAPSPSLSFADIPSMSGVPEADMDYTPPSSFSFASANPATNFGGVPDRSEPEVAAAIPAGTSFTNPDGGTRSSVAGLGDASFGYAASNPGSGFSAPPAPTFSAPSFSNSTASISNAMQDLGMDNVVSNATNISNNQHGYSAFSSSQPSYSAPSVSQSSYAPPPSIGSYSNASIADELTGARGTAPTMAMPAPPTPSPVRGVAPVGSGRGLVGGQVPSPSRSFARQGTSWAPDGVFGSLAAATRGLPAGSFTVDYGSYGGTVGDIYGPGSFQASVFGADTPSWGGGGGLFGGWGGSSSGSSSSDGGWAESVFEDSNGVVMMAFGSWNPKGSSNIMGPLSMMRGDNTMSALSLMVNGAQMAGGGKSIPGILEWGQQADAIRRQQMQRAKFAQMMNDPKYANMLPKSLQGMAQFLDPEIFAKLAMKHKLQQQKLAQGPKPTAMQQNFKTWQDNPEFRKFYNSSKPTTNVTVNSGDKQIGKKAGDYIFKSAEDVGAARKALNRYAVMEKLLQDPNVYTGLGGEKVLGLKKLAQTFGVDVEGVGTAELIQKTSRKAALALKDDLPGPMSNSDREFLQSLPAGLNTTPEGNRLVIGLAKLNEQYKMERAQAVVAYGKADIGVLSAHKAIDEKYAKIFADHVQQMRSVAKAQPRSPLAGVPSALNPKTGERLYLRNGKWVKE